MRKPIVHRMVESGEDFGLALAITLAWGNPAGEFHVGENVGYSGKTWCVYSAGPDGLILVLPPMAVEVMENVPADLVERSRAEGGIRA
jgi:hypothetical protein